MDRTDNKKGPEKGPAPFQDDIPFKSREDLTGKRFTLDKTEYIIFGELKATKYHEDRASKPGTERIYLAYRGGGEKTLWE